MKPEEIERRRPVWIALSDLWLDNEIDEDWAKQIAEVVVSSGFTEATINDVFFNELAPFLGLNHLVVAGEWAGFDEEWVCAEASKRVGKRGVLQKLVAKTGITTYAAREAFELVKQIAFKKRNITTV
jgi:hypothetical protein